MRLVRKLFRKNNKRINLSLAEYQRELLIKQGREQFKKLIDQGLGIPVGLL